jgi:hypothetical protein
VGWENTIYEIKTIHWEDDLSYDENIISALDFAERCIKLVAPNDETFLKIRECYRKNQLYVESFDGFIKDTPEYIISKAYEYFRFGCHHDSVSFYKKSHEKKLQLIEPPFINNICINKLFISKGLLNGELIYLSKKAIYLLINKHSIYNSCVIDSFMMRCFEKLVIYILKSLNVTTIPPLKISILNSYIDEVFPAIEYEESGFSNQKKEVLIYLFDKTRSG